MHVYILDIYIQLFKQLSRVRLKENVSHTRSSAGLSWWCMAIENPNEVFASPRFFITFCVSKLKAETCGGRNIHAVRRRLHWLNNMMMDLSGAGNELRDLFQKKKNITVGWGDLTNI